MPDPSMGSYPPYPWFRRAVLGIAAFLLLLTFQVFLISPTHKYLQRQAEEMEGKIQFLQSVQDTLIPDFQKKLKGLTTKANKVQAQRLSAKIDQLGHEVVEMGPLAEKAKSKRIEATAWTPALMLIQIALAFLALWVLFCVSKILMTPFRTDGMEEKAKRQKPIRYVRAGAWTAFPLVVLLGAAWALFHGARLRDEWIENLGPLVLGSLIALGVWAYSFRIARRVETSFGSSFWRFKETPLGRIVQGIWKSILAFFLTFISSHAYSLQDGRLVFEGWRARRYAISVFVWTAAVYSLAGFLSAQWTDRWEAPRGAGCVVALTVVILLLWLKCFAPRFLVWPGRHKVTCPLCGQETSTFLNRLCGTCGAFISRWGEKLETPFEVKGKFRSRIMAVGLTVGLVSVALGFLATDAAWRGLQGLVDRAAQDKMAQAGFYEPIRLHLPPVKKFKFCVPRRDLVWANLVQASVDAKAFRRKNGRWPNAAWELDQETGSAALYRDPYTNGRLKFLGSGQELVIYSVGPDRIDDEGSPYDPITHRGDMLVRLRDDTK